MAVAVPVAGDARGDSARAPLRLLWLIDSLTIGGAESLALSFARATRSRNIELTVCARTSIGGNPLESQIRAAGVDVVPLSARRLIDLGAFRQLLRILRERRIEVIHAHLTYASIWGALASRIARVPMVATLHVAPAPGGLKERLRQRLLIWTLNRWAARVVMVSEALRRSWPSLKKTVVIHNGVPEAAGAYAPAEAGPVVAVAVLRREKGIDVLVDAARKLPGVRFTIAGDGPMREELMRRAEGSNIQWLGHRDDVRELLRGAKLFVLPTLADAFPTVLLEAMAAGVPIVASNVGGVPEIVDESFGILVPPGDADALAVAIRRALDDESWRRGASRAAVERFEQRFSVDRWLDSLERLYAEVRP